MSTSEIHEIRGSGPAVQLRDPITGRTSWRLVCKMVVADGHCHFYGYRYSPRTGVCQGSATKFFLADHVVKVVPE